MVTLYGIGLPVGSLALFFAFKLLQIMTRYSMLLSGQALEQMYENACHAHSSAARSTPTVRYRLRIQSLELTQAKAPLQVTIRGVPHGTHTVSPDHHVLVAAGWKSIRVLRKFELPANQKPTDASDPYVWQAEFPELPALDVWSFDVIVPCQRVEISIGFVGVEQSKLLTPTFGPYFEPDRLIVFATDQGEPRISGPITMPRPVVPLILSALSVLLYVLFRIFLLNDSPPELLDGELLGIALCFIWVGYVFIRRPVYPVISGYRFITPPWPDGASKGPPTPGLLGRVCARLRR